MALYYITCPECHGSRYIDRPTGDGVLKCRRCDQGSVPIWRCPSSFQDDLPGFLAAYAMLTKHGIWPAPGGIEDQTCQFVDAVRVLQQEVAAIEKALRDEARRAAK